MVSSSGLKEFKEQDWLTLKQTWNNSNNLNVRLNHTICFHETPNRIDGVRLIRAMAIYYSLL